MEGNLKVPFISLHTVKPKKAFGLGIHLPDLKNVYISMPGYKTASLLFISKTGVPQLLTCTNNIQSKTEWQIKITGYAHLLSQGRNEKKVQPWLESLPAAAKATAEKA